MNTEQLIAAIKADREAGTPGFWQWVEKSRDNAPPFWVIFDPGEDDPDIATVTDFGSATDARRIARVPYLEAAFIAQSEEIERLREAIADYVRKSWREIGLKHPEMRNQTATLEILQAAKDSAEAFSALQAALEAKS